MNNPNEQKLILVIVMRCKNCNEREICNTLEINILYSVARNVIL